MQNEEGGMIRPEFILHSDFCISFDRRSNAMIALTRLNGQQFVVNAEKIRYIESTPDTVVCYDTGEKLMVRESMLDVMKKAIDYARVIRRPISD